MSIESGGVIKTCSLLVLYNSFFWEISCEKSLSISNQENSSIGLSPISTPPFPSL